MSKYSALKELANLSTKDLLEVFELALFSRIENNKKELEELEKYYAILSVKESEA